MMAAIWTLVAMLGGSQLAVFALLLQISGRIDALGGCIDNLSEAFVRHTHI